MIGMISSRIGCDNVGLFANPQHAADPAKDAPGHTAHNATHEAADWSEHLIPGTGTGTGTITGAGHNTLSVRRG
jgi:hypothetical protein